MLKTIGYAHSEQKNHYNITPLLFYNEPGLEHLDWVMTLFPQENAQNNTQLLNQKLNNFIQYYSKEPLLVIGGDASCLIGICQDYPRKASLSLEGPNIDHPPLPEHITLNGPSNQDLIICINAQNPIPKKIPHAHIIVIINYDQSKDPDKSIFNQLKKLLITTKV